jgi:sialidase-1
MTDALLVCLRRLVLPVAVLALAAGAPSQEGGRVVRDNGAVTRISLLPPGPGNPRNSEGDFIRLEDGRVLFVYTHFTEGAGDHSGAHLAGRYSSDGGLTWTGEDRLILPNEGTMNVMSVSLLRLQSGEIALFYLRKNSTEDCVPYMRISSDEAETWGEATRVVQDDGYFVLNNDRVVQLKGGRLVVPVSRHNVPAGEWTGAGMQMCWLSDDKGRTWRKSNEFQAPEGSGVVLQEPGVIELKDGRLMMLCRTNQGCQYCSWSEDGGETWTAVQRTDIISPLSPASFERIPGTGDILLVWNDHSDITEAYRGKRTPFTVAISRDEGETWEHRKILESDPEGWYCYTAIEFVGNRVLLGHCAGDPTVGRLSRTQITGFGVDWLYR